MLASALGAVLHGVEATLVTVEVDVANGLPAFSMVGLPDASVQEAKDRVRAALSHSGFDYPMQRITVNLAPSEVPKSGPGFDLPVAMGLLAVQGRVPGDGLRGRVFLGELGLSGEVRPTRGALASAEAARRAGLEAVVCPAANAHEAALAGIPAIGVASLQEAASVARGAGPLPVTGDARELLAGTSSVQVDLAAVRGQLLAKRALEVAAAGGHNLLMTGPPGGGKTLLARAMAGILPAMTVEEALEVTRIHSAAGLLAPGQALVCVRPFRAPHHGTSMAGMIGGGTGIARPGEVSIAHRGLLFLDELPEFPRSCLEALRQPLEDGAISVVRSRRAVRYPARFQLVAAMNPCPCGHRGSATLCSCTPRAREMYRQRLSGPLLDRIDLQITVPRVETDELLARAGGAACGSAEARRRVERARSFAAPRLERLGVASNAELPPDKLVAECGVGGPLASELARAADERRLSARGVHRVLRVARTIADLAERDQVTANDVYEAVAYRLAGIDEDGQE